MRDSEYAREELNMLPGVQDILLKQTVKLYDNVAKCGDCVGRLYAELQVYPSPRIFWEFESLGDAACVPVDERGVLPKPLTGHGFFIDKPHVSGMGRATPVGQQHFLLSGSTAQARYGELDSRAHSFTFYLPNARFQEENVVGQGTLLKKIRATLKDESWEAVERSEGRFIRVPIDNTWDIHLETRREALRWLEPKQNNVGTLITTVGRLYHPPATTKENQELSTSEVPDLTMEEAQERLDTLSLLLSFANGGYLGPLYIEGYEKGEGLTTPAATALAYRTTPIELLGDSWLTIHSDLETYIRCFPVLNRMVSNLPWRDALFLILGWYFQAIQPESTQMRGKSWPIVANAVGAALERLCVTIVVRELNVRGLSNLAEKVKYLLEQIGITCNRGYDDIDYVQPFVDIRNEATHPKPATQISDHTRNQILNRAIQWVEEALLWRLGYNGKYRDRLKDYYDSTEPRYDLNMRNSGW